MINFSSPQQLAKFLYQDLKLEVLEITDKDKPSTGKWALKKLRRQYPEHKVFFDNLKLYRTLKKYRDTYCNAWIEGINQTTNRAHFSIKIIGTESGRISSPIQQIPKRTEDAGKVRRAIIASPGCKLVEFDMKQIEARIRAHISQDPTLLKIFNSGDDIYKHTASASLGIPVNEITPEQRDLGKTIDLAISYGMTPWGLKDTLECSLEEAEQHLKNYFTKFPYVKIMQNELIAKAKRFGYSQTLLGLKRKLSNDINLPILRKKQKGKWRDVNSFKRAAVERQAVDYVMQGTTAQIVDLAARAIQSKLSQETKMIMQVHDALVFEIPESRLQRTVPFIKNTMENIYKLSIPCPVEVKLGDNLRDIVLWEEYCETRHSEHT